MGDACDRVVAMYVGHNQSGSHAARDAKRSRARAEKVSSRMTAWRNNKKLAAYHAPAFEEPAHGEESEQDGFVEDDHGNGAFEEGMQALYNDLNAEAEEAVVDDSAVHEGE